MDGVMMVFSNYLDSLKLTSKSKSSLNCIPAPPDVGAGRLRFVEDSFTKNGFKELS